MCATAPPHQGLLLPSAARLGPADVLSRTCPVAKAREGVPAGGVAAVCNLTEIRLVSPAPGPPGLARKNPGASFYKALPLAWVTFVLTATPDTAQLHAPRSHARDQPRQGVQRRDPALLSRVSAGCPSPADRSSAGVRGLPFPSPHPTGGLRSPPAGRCLGVSPRPRHRAGARRRRHGAGPLPLLSPASKGSCSSQLVKIMRLITPDLL